MFLVILLTGCATPQQTLLLVESPPDIPSAYEIASVPFYPQRDYQCGPAALATIINHYQSLTTPDELVPKVYIPQLKGSLQVEMIAAATGYGRLAVELDGRLESILREVAGGHPVLVMQNLGIKAYPFWHYAVVIGYDLDEREIILRSGEIERLVRPLSVFERTWQRANYWSIITVPPNVVPVTASEQQFTRAVLMHESSDSLDMRLQAYRTGVSNWPDSFVLNMGLGNSLYAKGDFTAAESSFRKAADIEPKRPEAWNNLAYALLSQQRKRDALQAVRKAIQLDPTNEQFQGSLKEIQQQP